MMVSEAAAVAPTYTMSAPIELGDSALVAANRAVKLGRTPQNRGKSKQDFGTPGDFTGAIKRRYGPIGFDLCARADNSLAGESRFGPEHDSLVQDWGSDLGLRDGHVAFCNPPFADLRPWVAKAEACRWLPRWTLLLLPASMGSRWWADHVIGKCQADGISRMQFVGADSIYPKDLALLAYGFGVNGVGFWPWKEAPWS